jgi:hypothetical protein
MAQRWLLQLVAVAVVAAAMQVRPPAKMRQAQVGSQPLSHRDKTDKIKVVTGVVAVVVAAAFGVATAALLQGVIKAGLLASTDLTTEHQQLILMAACLVAPVYHIIQTLLGKVVLTPSLEDQVLHLLCLIYPECL